MKKSLSNMTKLKSFIIWLAGAVFALAVSYRAGKKDGKNEEMQKQKDKTLQSAAMAKRIDNLSDADIDRLPSKYD